MQIPSGNPKNYQNFSVESANNDKLGIFTEISLHLNFPKGNNKIAEPVLYIPPNDSSVSDNTLNEIQKTSRIVKSVLNLTPDLSEMIKKMENEGPIGKRPGNFRQILLNMDGHKIALGLMAHPVGETPVCTFTELKVAQTVQKLKSAGYNTLISLAKRDQEQVFKEWSTDDRIYKYYSTPIEDYEAPNLNQVLDICQFVKDQASEGKNVIIHCGEGWGRSGTIGACLVLHELVKDELNSNSVSLNPNKGKVSLRKFVPGKGGALELIQVEVETDYLVAKAINKLREQEGGDIAKRRSYNRKSLEGHSVENEEQIKMLESLASFLRGAPPLTSLA